MCQAPQRRLRRSCVTSAVIGCAMTLTVSAHAGEWLVDGVIGIQNGLEGADTGNGALEWQQARWRLATGFDLTDDETPRQSFSVRGLVELQKSALVGGELRYVRWLGGVFGGYASATALVTPESLVGLGVGGIVVLPLGPLGICFEGGFSALPLGSDRVNGGTVLWALGGVGLRLRL
jgi:hypothetical protein